MRHLDPEQAGDPAQTQEREQAGDLAVWGEPRIRAALRLVGAD